MHAISGPSVSTMLPSQQVLLLEESTALRNGCFGS